MSIIEGTDNSMKVAVRFRKQNDPIKSEYINADNSNISFTHKKNEHIENYTYDYVFDEHSTQSQIYCEAISKPMRQYMDGFNVTVFAYGQTGSGKTYTIGSSKASKSPTEDNEGIISRALRNLFSSNHENFEIQISLLEIHKDKVNDLFNIKKKNNIIQNYSVKDLTKLTVTDLNSSMEIIQDGLLLRKVGKTSMNEESSRSHLVLTIYLENKIKNQTSKFNIVDLAGSEKAGVDFKNSSSSKEALEEGVWINQSLIDLRLLINRLVNGGNISYNANSLTKILKDSLGGNSYSLLIACVDTRNSCYAQTLETIKFANLAKSIKNNPFKLTTTVPVVNLDNILMEELEMLRRFKNDHMSKKNKLVETGTSPVKFKSKDSSILVSEMNNCDSPILISDIEYEDSSILDLNIGKEVFITGEKKRCIREEQYSTKKNTNIKGTSPLELFIEKKRFLKVGLKDYFENDMQSFRFYFSKKCFSHLQKSPQFPTMHQFRISKKGVASYFRCYLFYKIEKCQCRIKINYIKSDDSLEVSSHGFCDHFQNFYEKVSNDNIEDDQVSNDNSNKKMKLSLFQ